MTAYWCERAVLPTGVADGVRLVTLDGTVSDVVTGVPARPGDSRLPGLVLPGFANAHSHAFHRLLRGRTHDRGGTFWTWREEMYAVAGTLTPDTYLLVARALLLEALCAGWTVHGEFHYLHHGPGGRPYAEPNAMGQAVLAAAAEVGIRLTLLDTCYLTGGLAAHGYEPLDDVQRRFGDGSVEAWAGRVAALPDHEGPLVRVGAAAHSVRALTPEELGDLGVCLADPAGPLASGRPVHAHVSEQVAENDAALAAHGRTPTGLFADAGLLTDRFTAVHATHLTAGDVDLLAASGATACFCPTTEADLADGIGPARTLHDAGVPLALGSDQNAVVDPFREVQGLEGHERLAARQRGRLPLAALRAAGSEHGYRSLGWPEGGRLEAGALADLVAVDPASRRTVGSDPAQLLLTAAAPDVTDVVVGGRHLVQDRQHALGPVERQLADAVAAVRGAA